MRTRTDDFMQVCRRMQALMQEPASTATPSADDRLDDLVRRLSQRVGARQAA